MSQFDEDKLRQVGIRDTLVSMGANNDMIGWQKGANGGGTVTYGGNALMDVEDDNINYDEGATYATLGDIEGAIARYQGNYGLGIGGNASSGNASAAEREYTPNDRFSMEIDALLDDILNPEAFNYDHNNDESYQAYKEVYTNEGNRAAKDTLASASGMSGGRLNSWAVTAGNQANNYYMQQLAAKIPELEESAWQRYRTAIQDKYSQLNAVNALEEKDYNRFNSERAFDYNAEQDEKSWDYNIEQDEKSWDYTEGRDAIEDERYESETAHDLEREAIEDERYETQWQHQLDQEERAAANAASQSASNRNPLENATSDQLFWYEYYKNNFLLSQNYETPLQKAAAFKNIEASAVQYLGEDLFNELYRELLYYQEPTQSLDDYEQSVDIALKEQELYDLQNPAEVPEPEQELSVEENISLSISAMINSGLDDEGIYNELNDNRAYYIAEFGHNAFYDLLDQYKPIGAGSTF